MQCPRCRADLPQVAHFCHVCGQDQRSSDQSRRRSFAVKPDEPVASFALISSIMPRAAGDRPQTYRVALTLALVVALVAAIFGALPIAVLVAAFAIPIVYIVYLYDVNLWEDEPVPVTGLAFGVTGVLAIAFTLLWTSLRGTPLAGGALDGSSSGGPAVGMFLLMAVLIPVVSEAIKQVGPLVLASRPQFDDLMDGLTFGVISGVAYATFDTIVKHWDLITGGVVQADPGLWVSLIFLEGFVKPLVFGTATGIACAEFSGLGRGYDGFTPRYFRGLAEAVAANIAYQAGAYLFMFVGNITVGTILSVMWGGLILAILILRVRNVLHVGLMEAALERSARERSVGETGELEFCSQCEMPLLEHAAFCTACGTAVRVQAKAHQVKVHQAKTHRAKTHRAKTHQAKEPAPVGAGVGTAAGGAGGASGVQPQTPASPSSAVPSPTSPTSDAPAPEQTPPAPDQVFDQEVDAAPATEPVTDPVTDPATSQTARDRFYDDEEGRA